MASGGSGWQVFTKISSYARVPQGSILGPAFFVLYINNFPDDVICNNTICADETTLYLSVIRHLICSNNLIGF